jgi:hypothetical protein
MAYKFQIGDAKLSGSILTTANGSDVSSSDDLLAAGDVSVAGNITGSGMSLSDASGIAGTGLEDSSGALQVAASQSTITSIANDSLTLGRSDQQDMLDFSTDDRINFKVDNVERFAITNNNRVQVGSTAAPGGSTIPALIIGKNNGSAQGTAFFAKADTNKFRLDSEGSTGQPGVIIASANGVEHAGVQAHSLYLSTTGVSIYTSGSISASGDITGSGLSLSDASGIAGGSLEDDSGVLKVSDGGIDTLQLAADAVDGTKLADDAVASEHIADNAVLSAAISASAVTAAKIAAGAVETAKLAAGAVTAAKLATGSVETAKLADGAVTTAKLAADAVDGTKLADDAVASEHIADAAVLSASIAAGAVVRGHLAADAVDGTKLADDAVDSEHIAAGAVDTEHIADGNVTNAKLANASFSFAGEVVALGGTGSLDALSAGNGLTGTAYDGDGASSFAVQASGSTLTVDAGGVKVSDLGIDTAQLAADAVDGTKLADDAVASEHIADGAVLSASIAAGAVVRGHLAADAVDGTKLADDAVDSEHIAAGAVDTEHIADDNVTIAKLNTDVAGAGLVGGAGTPLRVDISTATTDTGAMAADTFILSALNAGSGQTRRRYLNRMPPAFLSSAIGQSQALEASGSAVTGFVMDLKDSIPGNRTFEADITIQGNLTVEGNQTALNTTELFVDDVNITIGSGSAPADNMGITFGTSGSVETLQIGNSETELQSSLPLSASTYYGDGSNLTNVVSDDSVQTLSSDVTISISNGLQVFADASGGAINLTLPSAANLEGKMLKVKQLGSANPVTLTPPAGNIDGAGSIVLESPYSAVTIIASGSNYYVI